MILEPRKIVSHSQLLLCPAIYIISNLLCSLLCLILLSAQAALAFLPHLVRAIALSKFPKAIFPVNTVSQSLYPAVKYILWYSASKSLKFSSFIPCPSQSRTFRTSPMCSFLNPASTWGIELTVFLVKDLFFLLSETAFLQPSYFVTSSWPSGQGRSRWWWWKHIWSGKVEGSVSPLSKREV